MHILKNSRPGLVRRLTLFTTSLLTFLCASNAWPEVVVIVSAKNPVTTLRVEQVSDIFLGQTGNFPGGAEAIPLDLMVDSLVREEFYSKVTGKSQPLMKAYWSKMLFTGRGQPPKEVTSSAVVRKLVADNPNLIGYIDKSAVDASVRVVLLMH